VGFGVEIGEAGQIAVHLCKRALSWQPLALRQRESVSRNGMRGANIGTARPACSAARRNAGNPSSRSQFSRTFAGCHASANRAVRRIAATLSPPLQIGGCGWRAAEVLIHGWGSALALGSGLAMAGLLVAVMAGLLVAVLTIRPRQGAR
jgi:hypothetical protein